MNYFNSHLKQLYISNKMECFSYEGVCNIHGYTHIETFKQELAWATDKLLRIIAVICLNNIVGANLSEPHHIRSTVKSVFLIACLTD